MRFAYFTLPLLGLAAAHEMSLKMARQLQPIQAQLDGIMSDVEALDVAINAWNGGSPQPVIDGSKKIVQATSDGTKAISGLQPVSLNDAVVLQKYVRKMTETITKTVNDLIAKKQAASSANLGGVTYEQLQEQYKGADAIAQAITSKVPEKLSAAATELSKGILAAIQKGIDSFSDIKTQVAPPDVQAMVAGGAAGGAAAAAAGGTMPAMTTGGSAAAPTAAKPAAAATTTAAAGGNSTTGAASQFKAAPALAALALAALAL